MPLTPPDPQQWTWLDTFTRSFLGPDYTVSSNNDQGALIETDVLTLGPVSIYSPTAQRVAITLNANRWRAPHLQVQIDHRWTLAPNSSPTSGAPAFLIEFVGESSTLKWDQARLTWGAVNLAALSVPYARDTEYRTTLTIDLIQARIQILRSGVGLVDVPLPADWADGMGAGGVIRIGHGTAGNGSSDFGRAVTALYTLAVRSGDGSADLSTGGASSGGVRLGGEWRFAPGAPDDAVGSDGDVWADTGGSGLIFQRQGGQYRPVTHLLGTPGLQGPAGPQGPQGATGPAGRDGADGQRVGAVAAPILLGDATPDGGLLIPVTADPGGLAGFTLLGVDGPPASVDVSADTVTFTPVTFPLVLAAGTTLRLIRADRGGGVTLLRARTGPLTDPGGGGGDPVVTPFTVQTDSEGYQTLPEGEVTTDADGYQTITNGAATPDPDGFETVERSTP